jgi:AcrR family transcriptional regulator
MAAIQLCLDGVFQAVSQTTTNGMLREPQQERTRLLIEKICAATVRLVLAKGAQAINTNAIAQEAGIDVSSLYRFFRDKESILFYIADRWLADIRGVYDRYRSDPVCLALPWRTYFERLLHDWRLPGQKDLYACMTGIWNYFPELEKLNEYQRAFHVAFFVEQFERFGARGSKKEWELLATYLYHVEDAVHEAAACHDQAEGQAILDLFYESFFLQVGRYLGDAD